jgi:hypothetical protein
VGGLSKEWDVSAMNGPWWNHPSLLVKERSNGVGFLHFNGGGSSSEAFFDGKKPRHYKNDKHWNLAKYYVDLPWEWAYFQLSSRVQRNGPSFQLQVHHQWSSHSTATAQ